MLKHQIQWMQMTCSSTGNRNLSYSHSENKLVCEGKIGHEEESASLRSHGINLYIV